MSSKYLCPKCLTADFNLEPFSQDMLFCKCGNSFELNEMATKELHFVPYKYYTSTNIQELMIKKMYAKGQYDK